VAEGVWGWEEEGKAGEGEGGREKGEEGVAVWGEREEGS
jgi:hypothetical protein